jgi:hypothetical protein
MTVIKFRRIEEGDFPAVISLLERGFPDHTGAYWTAALDRLKHHATPNGYPKYGHVIDDNNALVGVILAHYCRNGLRKIRK